MENQVALTGKDLINMVNGFQMSQILVTASTLGIFEELHKNGQMAVTAVSVAKSLRTHPDATARLMNSCAGLGLLEKHLSPDGNEVYRNATATEKYLVATSAMSIAPLVAKMGDLYHLWGKLRQGVKEGKSLMPPMGNTAVANGINAMHGVNGTINGTCNGHLSNGHTNGMIPPANGVVLSPTSGKINPPANGMSILNHGTNGVSNGMTIPNGNRLFEKGNPNGMFMSEEKAQEFLKCMHIFCKMDAPFVTKAFDLSEFKSVCDLGGATGVMAVELASAFPDMHLTVFDLPHVIATAPKFQRTVPNNVCFKSGDFFKDELPAADLYILSHILHDWNEEKANILLKKIYASLRPGGALLVLEKVLNEEKDGPIATLLFDLGMLMLNEGRERTAQEYTKLLSSHGFQGIQVEIIAKSQYRDAILARKM